MKKIKPILFYLIIISTSDIYFSQNYYNFKQFGNEAVEFIKQPSAWKIEDWGKLGLISLSTILTMNVDEPVRDEILKDREYYNSIPIEFGRIWGEPYTSVSIAGLFALSGVLNKNSINKKIGFEVFESLLFSGTVTQFSKMILGRARPYNNEGAFSYHPLNFTKDKYWAHPSGHTTLAFSLSTILSKNSKSDLIKAIVYIPACLTAFSRVYQDYHWTSDVLLGAFIGYFVAEWVYNIHENKNKFELLSSNQLLTIAFPL